MKAKIIKTVSFLLVAVLVVCSLNSILKFKYGESLRPTFSFYEQEDDTVDVLILGSSHAYTNIHPAVLWDNFGYSAYVLGTSVQPLWNTYYYLEEALKTQTPKVIVLEGYRLVETSEYTSTYYAIKATYGLKWSKTKLNAMKASFSEEKLSDYIFEFANYHSRYSDLSKGDFRPYLNNEYFKVYKGELNKTETYSLGLPDVSQYSAQQKKLSAKTEEYYIKILELAKENNIPVMTVISPYNMSESEYGYYKYAETIAEKYSMPFINGNEMYGELSIDSDADFSDKYGHLSSTGAEKLTKYIGSYINDNYYVDDHRGDDRYQSWDIYSRQFERYYYSDGLTEITELSEYAEKLKSLSDYSFVLLVNSGESLSREQTDFIKTLLPESESEITDGAYVVRNGEMYFSSGDEDLDKNIHFDSQTDIRLMRGNMEFTIKNLSDTPVFCAYINSNDSSEAMPLGITLIVYDELFGRVTETVYSEAGSSDLTRENSYVKSEE